jgi:glycosyltransferase involved in cell wall biosynthesis
MINSNFAPLPPRVTALLLTWNAEETIAETLASLLAQDYSQFEILISDDASSDNTASVCERIAAKDARVQIVRQPKNLGSFENFHAAAAMAKGRFVFWACPGDTWDPRFVSACVEKLESVSGAVAAMPSTDYVAEKERKYLRTERFDQLPSPEDISHWKLAVSLPVKSRPTDDVRRRFGLFIHGLLDRAILCLALDSLAGMGGIANERVVMCQFALAGRFVTVPEVLFFKEASDRSYVERAPHDPNARLRREQRWFLTRIAWQLAVSLSRSRAFPLRRKVYMPLIVVYYLVWNLWHRARIKCVAGARALLPAPVYKAFQSYRAGSNRATLTGKQS